MSEPYTIIFIGPQGSGKGTQVVELAKRLREQNKTIRVVDVQTGRRFRALAAKEENYTEKSVANTIDSGVHQPLFLSVVLWGDAFLHNVDSECHLLIDGFPRTVEEAVVLESALAFYKRAPLRIIVLEVPEDEVRERMKMRARKDDTDVAIEERLRSYREGTLPVISYFEKRPETSIYRIDGRRSIREVAEAIDEAIGIV
jgi:adenylate kinase